MYKKKDHTWANLSKQIHFSCSQCCSRSNKYHYANAEHAQPLWLSNNCNKSCISEVFIQITTNIPVTIITCIQLRKRKSELIEVLKSGVYFIEHILTAYGFLALNMSTVSSVAHSGVIGYYCSNVLYFVFFLLHLDLQGPQYLNRIFEKIFICIDLINIIIYSIIYSYCSLCSTFQHFKPHPVFNLVSLFQETLWDLSSLWLPGTTSTCKKLIYI